jgi:hypothetical protein
MANKYWQGGAAAIKQTRTFTFGGTAEANDIIRVSIGNRIYDFVTGTTVIDDALAALVTSWTGLDSVLFPEFAEIVPTYNSATNVLTLTAATEGVSFTVSMRPYESDGTTPATDLTIEGSNVATTGTAGTANSSPNSAAVATNWSGGTLPANNDVLIFSDGNVDCTDDLDLTANNYSVIVEQSYTGKIGRPLVNPNGYVEYRPAYLSIGADDTDPQVITIGQGPGQGSGRIKINTGASASTFIIYNTGTPLEANIPAVLIKGTDITSVTVNKGSVGIAALPYDESGAAEEAATVTTLNVGYVTNQNADADVQCGSGVTLTTVNQSGGRLEINSAATTVNITGGTLTVAGTGVTVATLNIEGGAVYVISTTTITTANLANAGLLDYSRDSRGKVITNALNCYGRQFKFRDPFRVVSSTSGGNVIVDLEHTDAIANLELGSHIKLTRALL